MPLRDENPSDIDSIVEPAHPNLLRMERMLKRNRVGQWLPLIVFAVSVFLTYQVWLDAEITARKQLQTEFDFRVHEFNRRIEMRMRTYKQTLRGAAGLFAATGLPSREQFRAYVDSLRLNVNYPGIQGIGYAVLVPPDIVDDHVRQVREQGFPDYTIEPPGPRPVVTSILYLEPFYGRNLRAFGFDMYSEPARRAAMEYARDTGRTALSGKVTLAQETGIDVQAGFLMYLPVYRPDAPRETLAERRANLAGWVYAPFRMRDLIASIQNEQSGDLGVEIYDGPVVRPDALMLDLHPDFAGNHTDAGLSRVDRLQTGGHEWTIVSHALPPLRERMQFGRSETIIAFGLGASLLLALLSWLFVDDRIYAMRSARQAMQLALYDPLTGLPNRQLMDDLAAKAIVRARRDDGKMAMMFIDLDHFKPVNDTHGHAVGDLLLKEVAQRLRQCVRRSDTVARIGGDEFVVLLPTIREPDSVMAIADKILDALDQPFEIAGYSLSISSSIGIAIYPENGVDVTALLKQADTAMYAAKEAGRNRAAFARR
jgi:diguanylate cyclase (GGDEF)-like protein